MRLDKDGKVDGTSGNKVGKGGGMASIGDAPDPANIIAVLNNDRWWRVEYIYYSFVVAAVMVEAGANVTNGKDISGVIIDTMSWGYSIDGSGNLSGGINAGPTVGPVGDINTVKAAVDAWNKQAGNTKLLLR